MNIKNFKAISVISAVLLTMLVGTAFLAAPYIGSAYLMIMKGTGDQFPVLTSEVALPLLRAGIDYPCKIPVSSGWANAVWLLLFASPSGILLWTWKGKTLEDSIVRWVSGLSIFIIILATMFLIIVAGLAVSMACM